jgi:acyl-CoA thioesterase
VPIRGVDPANIPARYRAIFGRNPFAEHFDLEVVSAQAGRAILRFPFKREYTQYQGAVQGGIVVAYADAAMAVAVAGIIPEGRDFVTTDLTVQYVRAFTSGAVVARGEIAEQGNTLLRGRAEVEIEGVGVAAYCLATFMIVSPRGIAAS